MEGKQVANIKVKTNYFRFLCNSHIMKYKVDTEPQVPSTQVGLLFKILLKLKDTLNKLFITYQPFNFSIYSPNTVEETTLEAEYENVKYIVKIVPTGFLEFGKDRESLVFMGRFLKLLQGQLKFKQFGRKYFDQANAVPFSSWKLSVWPGYQTSLNSFGEKILLNVDSCFKVLRETTVHSHIQDLMQVHHGNQDKVKEELINTVIMTRYNNEMYKIDDLDFSLNPMSSFPLRSGGETTYADYYEKKHKSIIKDKSQPLIYHKRKQDGKIVYLVPELCVLTGQSNEMRQNFTLQKDLNTKIKPTPQQRIYESQKLVALLNNSDKTKAILDKWQIKIEQDPMCVNASRLFAGHVVMGGNNSFAIEGERVDFDRNIQKEMLRQIELSNIKVFCPKRDVEHCKAFLDTLNECVKTFKYPITRRPKEVLVDGRSFDDWKKAFERELDPSVQCVILLLPGKKKSAPFYDQAKHLLLTQFPIPSQVVLIPTIQAGKNFRSIVSKVLIQICSKVGGVPWSLSDLPFTDVPLMVVGIDVYHSNAMKKNSLLGFCATVDKNLARYWSTIDLHAPGEEIGKGIQNAMKEAALAFQKSNNGIFPHRIFVFRDGVSDSQRRTMEEIEVKSIIRAFEELEANHGMGKPEFVFVCVNKRITTKFFTGDDLQRGDLKNPDQGTVISDEITTGKDFYLVSQKTTQGSATPTHYFLLGFYRNVDNTYNNWVNNVPQEVMKQVQMLTYKLCYLYFNWSGSIKVPAPIQYAHRLSNFIGDRWKQNQNNIPHTSFQDKMSLYFI